MPLTPCLDCGHDVSDRALSCPHCGRPSETAARATRLEGVAVWQKSLIAVFVAGYVVLGCLVAIAATSHDIRWAAALLAMIGYPAAFFEVAILVCTIMLGSKLYNPGVAIVFAFLMTIPLFNLIALVALNARATAALRNDGRRVGLRGAKAGTQRDPADTDDAEASAAKRSMFRVVGAHRETGRPLTVTIPAHTAAEAESLAATRRAMLVSSVEPA